jgi:hypothetical protein
VTRTEEQTKTSLSRADPTPKLTGKASARNATPRTTVPASFTKATTKLIAPPQALARVTAASSQPPDGEKNGNA